MCDSKPSAQTISVALAINEMMRGSAIFKALFQFSYG
jgi:hypothetical protein